MKIIRKYFSIILVLAIIISCLVMPTKAVVACGSANDGYICHGNIRHTLGYKVMNYGVGQYGSNRRYFWMSGLNSNYQNLARNAVSDWVYTTDDIGVTTSISIRETSTRSNAMFEIVAANDTYYVPSNAAGATKLYLNSNRVTVSGGALTSNYGWARCIINVDALATHSDNTKQSTIAHELGHAMGLSERNCRADSIMCQLGYGRRATRANADDLSAINHLYG